MPSEGNVFEKSGYYPDNFFYGMEEYDLSYRALSNGYRIVYDDKLLVLHKESPLGRQTPADKLRGMWVNKSIVTWKYLPTVYFYTTSILWSLQYLKKTGFDFSGWIRGWKEVFRIPSFGGTNTRVKRHDGVFEEGECETLVLKNTNGERRFVKMIKISPDHNHHDHLRSLSHNAL
jgi:hypothetical protein